MTPLVTSDEEESRLTEPRYQRDLRAACAMQESLREKRLAQLASRPVRGEQGRIRVGRHPFPGVAGDALHPFVEVREGAPPLGDASIGWKHVRLLGLCQRGDVGARNELAAHASWIMAAVAERYRARAADHYVDLLQEAYACLLETMSLWRPLHESFSSYVKTTSRSAIRSFLTKTDAAIDFEDHEEWSDIRLRRSRSLSEPVDEDGDGVFDSLASDEETPEEIAARLEEFDRLLFAMNQVLTDRNKKIMALLWFSATEPSLREVGRPFGLSTERVRMIRERMLRDLRGAWRRGQWRPGMWGRTYGAPHMEKRYIDVEAAP